MPEQDADLASLCEPFFAEVCAVRSAAPPQPAAAGRVLAAMESVQQKSRLDPELEHEFRAMQPDLYYFADSVLSRRIAGWRSLAEQWRGVVTGEESLCLDMETAVADERRGAAAVFRTCVGLGFDGADAVGAERWKRTVDALFHLDPVCRPSGMAAANPAAPSARRGPVRRTSVLALFFLFLSLVLAGLTVWTLWRAPVRYRERAALLRGAAAANGAPLTGFAAAAR